MSKFYLSLVKSFHKKGLGVTILKSDLMLNNHTVGPSASQRTYGRFQDVLGTSAASSADQSLVLSCFYDLEMLEDPEVRCIWELSLGRLNGREVHGALRKKEADTAELVVESRVESVLAMVGLWGVGSNVPNI